ncbi:MAG TPA: hypothetical protein VKQ27_12395 [Acetobacteraceae bacterium]|nr:hypothetical protein [Acetobacteraceae bacterium]
MKDQYLLHAQRDDQSHAKERIEADQPFLAEGEAAQIAIKPCVIGHRHDEAAEHEEQV